MGAPSLGLRQFKSAPAPFFGAASENPFNHFPPELLLKIFSYLDPKQVIANLSLVCRSFRVLSQDPQLWLHFCQTLGLNQLEARQGVEPRKHYFTMARLNENIRSHQFVIERVFDFSKAPHACDCDLYCLKENDGLSFYHTWSRRLEFTVTPQIEIAATVEQVFRLANQGLDLLANQSQTTVVGKLETIFRELSKLSEGLKRFQTLTDIIDNLSVEDWEIVKVDLEDLCAEANIFYSTQNAAGLEVEDLAVNERYCGILFRTGLVEVYDREAKAIIYTAYYPFAKSIHMAGSAIYTCLREVKKVIGYDLTSGKKRIITNTDQFRVLNDQECFLEMNKLITLYNPLTGITEALFGNDYLIVDFCYSAQNQSLAIAYRNAAADWVLFVGLTPQSNGGYTFSSQGKYRMDTITHMQWQGSFLYIAHPQEITRINPFVTEEHGRTVWQAQNGESVTGIFWCADLLFIQTEKKTEEDEVVRKSMAYNYFVTFGQVAADLILGYRSDDLRHLEMRFHGFTHAQKEGICRYLPHNGSSKPDLGSWESAQAEDKAFAIESYLKERP